ncbi:MAG: DUF790 family protein [Proteobacteria bacterium]|nr:DUF790 family protein [Pseudomonadota bacterium]MCP4918614.1 DUF790 family protein [Pseudomonadota bacterium]
MLTGDLVRVRNTKDGLKPGFVKHDDRILGRATELLDLYLRGVDQGLTRQELAAEVGELVGDATDHKIWRGMAKLLGDKSEFVTDAPMPPGELRERLFTLCGKAPSRAHAAEVYAQVAQELDSTPEDLRRLLFADRKEEQQIAKVGVPDAPWLVHRYNVSLVQSCLIKATQVTVRVQKPTPARLRQLFRHVRFHQLMYRVRPIDDGVELVLDGPASLLRLNTRYGMALANWFPALLLQKHWTLEAEVRWTKRRLRKSLALDSSLGLTSHYKDRGAWRSKTEEWFVERFEALDTDWEIAAPAVLDLGGEGVICPSFTFKNGHRVAHLEVVGFWRKDWLARRLKLIEAHGPGNLILAVSTKMEGAKQGLGKFGGRVVTFKSVVPAKDVVAQLDAIGV